MCKTAAPSLSPTLPSLNPSAYPTMSPTTHPTHDPTPYPTSVPTSGPTAAPQPPTTPAPILVLTPQPTTPSPSGAPSDDGVSIPQPVESSDDGLYSQSIFIIVGAVILCSCVAGLMLCVVLIRRRNDRNYDVHIQDDVPRQPQFNTVPSREPVDLIGDVDTPGADMKHEESDEFDIGMNDINLNEIEPVMEHANVMVTRIASEKSNKSTSTKYTNEGRKSVISVGHVMGIQMTEL